MEQVKIVIAGCGKMATALMELCLQTGRTFCKFTDNGVEGLADLGNVIAIHFGSGRQLLSLCNWCQANNVPLIQGSTGQTLPNGIFVSIVNAPNLSLPIVKFLKDILPALEKTFKGMEVNIVESHQKTKKTIPGTALRMADAFGIEEKEIISVRKEGIQSLLGVNKEYLGAHGYHWITIKGFGAEITVSTKVNGRLTYAEGALAVADEVNNSRDTLSRKVYDVTEIVDMMDL